MDSLRLLELPRSPRLSAIEVRQLLQRAQNGDLESRDQLITANLRLVMSIVQRFKGRGELEDLFQVGCLGLVKAIENFDLNQPVRFSTYAVPVIIGEIRRAMRNDKPMRVSRSIQDLGYAVTRQREEMAQKLGRQPTPGELAEALGVDRADVVVAMDALVEPASFSEVVHEDEGQPVLLGDQIGVEAEQESWLHNYALRDVCQKLPDPDGKLVHLRFFKGLTQTEVARTLGVSQAQVSRLEKRALQVLRRMLA